jgi:hypothetical protein
MDFWVVVGTSSLVAAVATLIISRVLKQWDDDALRTATKQVIQAEIDYACEFARDYLKPGSVKSPMHRITTAFHDEGIPKLVALGSINYECAWALLQYYGNVDQMNRSLDLVQSLESLEDKKQEMRRTFYKACSLIPIQDLQQLAALPRADATESRIISKKHTKYEGVSPYDRVKRAMGRV